MNDENILGPTCRRDEVWTECGNECFADTCGRERFCPLFCKLNGGCVCRKDTKRGANNTCVPCNA